MTRRFNLSLDILLLKEVVAVNPYNSVKGRNKWEEIVDSLNVADECVDKYSLKVKSCQARIRTLLEAHRNKEMASLKASGTEEEYTERDALLTDLVDLIEESNAEISSTKDKRDEERQKELKGVMIREAAMQSLKRNTPHVESDDESCNQKEKETPKRKRKSNMLEDYMKLRQEQVALEREKFEIDRNEREAIQAREKKESDQRMARDIAMIEILKRLSEK